jgi:hypothetical protein
MKPAKDDGPGLGRAVAIVPNQGRAGLAATATTATACCRWCGRQAAWSWSLGDDAAADPEGLLGNECLVCEDCQALTLAGDDAALLDRVMAVLASRVPFPYASAFVREQEAARLAHWIARRSTFRPC